MNNLHLETQGVKGSNTKTINSNGSILVQFEKQIIMIDNYEGRGNTYKQREVPLIEIIEDGTNLFSGTFEELKIKIQ